MTKKSIFSLLIFIISLQLSAQKSEKFLVQIPWQSTEIANYKGVSYSFPKLSYGLEDGRTGLPLFSFSKIIDNEKIIASVSVVALETGVVVPSEKDGIIKYDEIASFSPVWNNVCELKKNGVLVEMNPLFINANGEIVVAKSVEITINYGEPKANLLKSVSLNFATKSVLSQGAWVKVKVGKSGIHQLSYATLAAWGFSNPAKVKVFGNGGDMLPRSNSEFREDDLVENAVYDNGNALLFYAKGVVNWQFDAYTNMYIQELNEYDFNSYYFITENDEPRKAFIDMPSDNNVTQIVTNYTAHDFYEKNSVSLIKSGRLWVGEQFSSQGNNSEKSFTFATPDIDTNSPNNVKVNVNLLARSDQATSFKMFVNDNAIPDATLDFGTVLVGSNTDAFAINKSLNFGSSSYSDITKLALKYNYASSTSLGWLNSITINTFNNLIFHGGELPFRNQYTTGDFEVTKFKMAGVAGKTVFVLDVTNPTSPIKIESTITQDTLSFGCKTDLLKEFLAFEPTASFTSPTFVEGVQNQNLHSKENISYVIVTPNEFFGEATALAKIHSTYNDIVPFVVSSEQIYNEFSSGKQDPMAIRAFMRMLYAKAGSDSTAMPKILLLYGDGSYDNLGVNPNTKGKIVTYQSKESLHQTNSYVTDDGFGFLDDSDGTGDSYNKMDIGVGRFVINSVAEAQTANSKVLAYLTNQDKTDWQTRITFLAQDGDNNLHQSDAESVSALINASNPQFELNKIYADAYPKVTNSQFVGFPEADIAIKNALVNNGTLIFNYTGHGAITRIANGWLNTEKVDALNNIQRLPFFVTATCEVSRYDNPEEKSLGEHIFLNPLGGGIGLVSTTRVVYANGNKDLNLNFYKNVFSRDGNNEPLRLGEVMRRTKIGAASSVNKLNFSLFCDPGLRLNYPSNLAKVNEIKNVRLDQITDTISGLTLGRITGEVQNYKSQTLTGFNGTATITLYDKRSKITTLGNSGQTPMSFEVYQNVLYKGKTNVENGLFSSEFIVPQDINYEFGVGKIAVYAMSVDSVTAIGIYNKVVVGGLDPNADYLDTETSLALFMNSLSFVDGGQTGTQPLLIAQISDLNGINTAGSGIGHDLLLTIDDNPMNSYILNSYFESDPDKYNSGSVKFQLPALSFGTHTATLRVWDCINNSSSKTITFNVSSSNVLEIIDATLSPNPLNLSQVLRIKFNHNEPNTTLTVQMAIYSFEGTLIDQQEYTKIDHNGLISDIEWTPRSSSGAGLNEGLYICKLWVSTSNGKNAAFSKKFVIVR